MYTRSYGNRRNEALAPLPPDYGGTALVIHPPDASPGASAPLRQNFPEKREGTATGRPLSDTARPPRAKESVGAAPFGGRIGVGEARGKAGALGGSPAGEASLNAEAFGESSTGEEYRNAEAFGESAVSEERRNAETLGGSATREEHRNAEAFGRNATREEHRNAEAFESSCEREAEALPVGSPSAREEEGEASGVKSLLGPLFRPELLRSDDLLLLGLIFLLLTDYAKEGEEGNGSCREALLLLVILYLSGI